LQKTTVEDVTGLMQEYDPAIYRDADGEAVFGGKHYVYIWRADSIAMNPTSPWK
jgi:hypothetical protein